MRHKFQSVDEYIASFPASTQQVLQQIRKTIKKELPSESQEVISYNIPTFKLNGSYITYYAGFEHHVSLYPIPHSSPTLIKKLTPYIHGKGTLRFALDEPLPWDLIQEVVKTALQDNLERAAKPK